MPGTGRYWLEGSRHSGLSYHSTCEVLGRSNLARATVRRHPPSTLRVTTTDIAVPDSAHGALLRAKVQGTFSFCPPKIPRNGAPVAARGKPLMQYMVLAWAPACRPGSVRRARDNDLPRISRNPWHPSFCSRRPPRGPVVRPGCRPADVTGYAQRQGSHSTTPPAPILTARRVRGRLGPVIQYAAPRRAWGTAGAVLLCSPPQICPCWCGTRD